MTLTDERVRALRKIVRRERIDGTTAEQLSDELTQLCDFWLKSHERPMQPSETCDVHGCDIHTSSEYHGRSCRPRFCDIEDYGRPAEGVSVLVEADAARYQWLRNWSNARERRKVFMQATSTEGFDAAIDAAIDAERERG